MRNAEYIITFILLLVLQLILAKYGQVGPYLYICILPAMILCVPLSRQTWLVMFVAFLCGMLIDVLADGVPGLNASALVLCAAVRKPIIRVCIDRELVERNYSFSFKQNGFLRVASALLLMTAIHLFAYLIFDSAGTRNFLFILLKFLISTSVSFIFGAVTVGVLTSRQK